MTHTNTIIEKAYLVGVTILSTAIIYVAWGHDEPIFNFALLFAGLLLGHVITEVLNEGDE